MSKGPNKAVKTLIMALIVKITLDRMLAVVNPWAGMVS